MTYKDLKVSLRNEERRDVCFYGPSEEKPHFCPITLCKQVSYRVNNALNISDMQPHSVYTYL